MALTESLYTGFGSWNPLAWIVAFIISLLIAWLIWKLGESDYHKDTEQIKPYLSGNAEPEKGDVHVRAGNMYWGFTEALKGYYDILIPLHTGILTDYMIWFLCVIAIVMVIVIGGGMI
ncbi:hydrogenase [Methanoplanus sp. FWC-SCC4]|uniref:Hydrogenase n=1 Tax=Methanochimaera problematica TaxID=2609417 RepID=A0AA97I4C3_9EURY|nr:hydrogenase [Methanoplanus sp. FWC-SCC4]WOF16364.1 hydrogenase [Methanoplanus sp. FWC-SCC4]